MGQIELDKPLAVEETPVPGFLRTDLTAHGDNHGWFEEDWQREKMLTLGLLGFGPVQNNTSLNNEIGVTRGIHAGPWDGFVSVATGRVFDAQVDLYEGPLFGAVCTCEIDPPMAAFVPQGIGSPHRTLESNAVYTYLVNDHWSVDARYTSPNLVSGMVNVSWSIALSKTILSDKDKTHPRLAEVAPSPTPGAEVQDVSAHRYGGAPRDDPSRHASGTPGGPPSPSPSSWAGPTTAPPGLRLGIDPTWPDPPRSPRTACYPSSSASNWNIF